MTDEIKSRLGGGVYAKWFASFQDVLDRCSICTEKAAELDNSAAFSVLWNNKLLLINQLLPESHGILLPDSRQHL